MPPKKPTTVSNRTESPPGPLAPVTDEEQEPSVNDDDDSATPLTTADYRRLLDRLNELEAREHQHQRQVYPESRPKEPKIPPPPEFHGKVSEYRNFMAQCSLTFTLCPRTYSTEESKVLFVVSRLRDQALNWARDIPENPEHPYRHDYQAFKAALDNLYLDRNYRQLCRDKLAHLSQTGSAAAYSAEFQSLVEPLNWNNDAKCDAFYEGLHDDIKNAMAIVGPAITFDALISQAIGLDQRARQARREKKSAIPSTPASSNSHSSSGNRPSQASTAGKPQSQSRDPNPHYQSQSQFKPYPGTASNRPPSNSNSGKPAFQSPYRPNPSSTNQPSRPSGPRGPLSEEERARRQQLGLCMYCGDSKHSRDNCPSLLAREALLSAIHFVPPNPLPDSPNSPSENYQSQAPPRSEA